MSSDGEDRRRCRDRPAEDRELFAKKKGNGVTGYVAATGKSYLCHDVRNDKLYIPGAPDALSSLTVPIIYFDRVIGTFNVARTNRSQKCVIATSDWPCARSHGPNASSSRPGSTRWRRPGAGGLRTMWWPHRRPRTRPPR